MATITLTLDKGNLNKSNRDITEACVDLLLVDGSERARDRGRVLNRRYWELLWQDERGHKYADKLADLALDAEIAVLEDTDYVIRDSEVTWTLFKK